MRTYLDVIATILAPVFAAMCFMLVIKVRRYREAWAGALERLRIASLKHEQAVTEYAGLSGVKAYWEKRASEYCKELMAWKLKGTKCAEELTHLSETIDALLHGDRRCNNSHLYYCADRAGQCPHCGASEDMEFAAARELRQSKARAKELELMAEYAETAIANMAREES